MPEIIAVSLTPTQWDVVLEAVSQRRTKRARTVGERIFRQLGTTLAYCRHRDKWEGAG